MANAVPQIRPVISTVSTINAQPEGEMDALLLGRTRVSKVIWLCYLLITISILN